MSELEGRRRVTSQRPLGPALIAKKGSAVHHFQFTTSRAGREGYIAPVGNVGRLGTQEGVAMAYNQFAE